MKRQVTPWEKTFIYQVFDKGLVSKIRTLKTQEDKEPH